MQAIYGQLIFSKNRMVSAVEQINLLASPLATSYGKQKIRLDSDKDIDEDELKIKYEETILQ